MTIDIGDKAVHSINHTDSATPDLAVGIWNSGMASLDEFKAMQLAQSSLIPALPPVIWCSPNGKPGVFTEGWESPSMIQKITKAGLSPNYCK
jgi:hypothetical protein